MKKLLIILVVNFLFFAGCKKQKEELTPLNVPSKYGQTMSRAIKKSKALDDILYLKNKITTFQLQEGRNPKSLEELVEKGYIEKLPQPPEGMQFVYDPKTGNVSVK